MVNTALIINLVFKRKVYCRLYISSTIHNNKDSLHHRNGYTVHLSTLRNALTN